MHGSWYNLAYNVQRCSKQCWSRCELFSPALSWSSPLCTDHGIILHITFRGAASSVGAGASCAARHCPGPFSLVHRSWYNLAYNVQRCSKQCWSRCELSSPALSWSSPFALLRSGEENSVFVELNIYVSNRPRYQLPT